MAKRRTLVIPNSLLREFGFLKRQTLFTWRHVYMARDTLGIGDIVFHTLDEGKGPSWEGKCIPLLGLERWFPNRRGPLIEKVCGLARSKPSHPRPMFKGIVANRRAIELGASDNGK